MCWVEVGLETFAAALKRSAGTRVALAAHSSSNPFATLHCAILVEGMNVRRCSSENGKDEEMKFREG